MERAKPTELITTLKSEIVRRDVREVGINPNYWYPLGWSSQLRPGQTLSTVVWQQAIAVYRDAQGQLYALENRCPHRGVELHRGKVLGSHLACAYHGWEFDGTSGACVNIPYLPKTQKLPCAHVRSYPIREKYGLIWVFPGDMALAEQRSLPDVPEFDQPDTWFMVPITAHFQAHFSVCNENAMDVFHGFLHQDLQGWFDPRLIDLTATDQSVCAKYQVSYKGRLAKFLGLSEQADEVTTLPITIRYRYPHYASSLEGVSSVYLMRLPVGPGESRSFALFFFKLGIPMGLVKPIKPLLQWVVRRFMLQKFLNQDIEMMESEQRQYAAQTRQPLVEINPAIIALQRVIVRQYEQFVQPDLSSIMPENNSADKTSRSKV
ncbi:MAG: aromatic ring-hydroxylating dioxygenase subunit alpha [Synechococcales bacterium]|nr:aromatic ring-hydroxylating dioxygenase subunit alpha [Synechococcales bacterium]